MTAAERQPEAAGAAAAAVAAVPAATTLAPLTAAPGGVIATAPAHPGGALGAARPAAAAPAAPSRAADTEIARWLAEYATLRGRESRSPSAQATLNDRKARIASHYANLVESIARRFLNSGEPFDDLVQEGFLGLLSALDNFDPAKNVKFSTYATHFVAGSIRHFLRDRGRIIKEPAWLHELCTRMNRVTDDLTQSIGRPASPAEIARAMNLTEEAVAEVLSTRQVFQVTPFGAAGDGEGGSGSGEADMAGVVDPEKIRSDRYVTLQLPIEDRIVLENAVDRLKALEQKVLYEFFYKDLNQTEIARQMGISCNYVSHILKNSTKKLKRVIGEAEVTDRGRSGEASIIDAPSGLFTAEHLLARVEEELSRAARAGQPAALLYVELGCLPQGQTGEGRLRRERVWDACGGALRRTLRRIDFAGRFDEDNLMAFLPGMRADAAAATAARLENALLAAEALIGEAITVQVTAAAYPEQGRGVFDLIGAARQQALSERLARSGEMAAA